MVGLVDEAPYAYMITSGITISTARDFPPSATIDCVVESTGNEDDLIPVGLKY